MNAMIIFSGGAGTCSSSSPGRGKLCGSTLMSRFLRELTACFHLPATRGRRVGTRECACTPGAHGTATRVPAFTQGWRDYCLCTDGIGPAARPRLRGGLPLRRLRLSFFSPSWRRRGCCTLHASCGPRCVLRGECVVVAQASEPADIERARSNSHNIASPLGTAAEQLREGCRKMWRLRCPLFFAALHGHARMLPIHSVQRAAP